MNSFGLLLFRLTEGIAYDSIIPP
ncbi:protein of unknown function (plasmid) [Azospirillum baldaniorum]|uniref:Uncharacterized protein n=1 Tax=Azospirillum baldaniorum TaxID=1064539 RepID=A0A9P1NQ04_9PROT|nr:protein of unknown function [Azospirillum baldaniorum]